jgi:HNH endonuclease
MLETKYDWFRRYQEFLRSEYWRNKAEHFKLVRGNQCEECGTSEHLHVHHLHYLKPWGHEDENDVEVLCRDCHADKHGRPLTRPRKHIVIQPPETVEVEDHGRKIPTKEFLRDGYKISTMFDKPLGLDQDLSKYYSPKYHFERKRPLKNTPKVCKVKVRIARHPARAKLDSFEISKDVLEQIDRFDRKCCKLSFACTCIERVAGSRNFSVYPDSRNTIFLRRREYEMQSSINSWPILKYSRII